MTEFFKNVWNWIRIHYIIAGIIVVVILLVIFILSLGGNGEEKVIVKRGTVTQTVQASGKTSLVQDADFGFEKSGKVAVVPVKVGDSVKAGSLLMQLEQGEAQGNLLKARATLARETANLNELRSGTRSEDLSISEAEKNEAEVALSDAANNLIVSMKRAYEMSDTAVRNYADQFFNNTDDTFPSWKSSFVASDGNGVGLNVELELRLEIVRGRRDVQKILPLWTSLVSQVSSTDSDITSKIAKEKEYLDITGAFLEDLGLGVNQMNSAGGVYDSVFAGFREDVGTARANVATAYTNLVTAEDRYNSARLALSVREREFDLKKAGSTIEALAAQEATVEESRGGLLAAEAELAKTVIRAPFDGTIGTVEAEVGEIVSPGTTVIRLIGNGNFDIEVDVSEVNIAKVNVGNDVRVVFDGLPSQTFYGKVAYIDPTETIIDNVVNYKVTVVLNLDGNDSSVGVKSGMTANLFVETAKKVNVLVAPLYALNRGEGGKYTANKLINGSRTEEIEVSLGIIGSDGNAEVLSGLSDEETIIIQK